MTAPDLIARLGAIFADAGYALFLVGGSVRDLLIHRAYGSDLDFTTDARPEEVQRLAAAARPNAVYTVGAKFGTVGLIFGDITVEITTYRAEHYAPPSRHPTVSFGVSLAADLARRDFTINAMALPARPDAAAPVEFGEIVDPYGGLRDLRDRVIRAVGDPHERFAEDPLRLLRAVRFVAQLGFTLDPATATAIREHAGLLGGISRERIQAEFTKLLLGDNARAALHLTIDLGLMRHIVPELLEMQRMPRPPATVRGYKAVLPHTFQVVERTPKDARVRWAALLHDIAKPRTIAFEHGEVQFRDHERVGAQMAATILRRLKFDAKTVEVVSKLVAMHGHANAYSDEWTDSAVRR
ncbi:MAG: CCA tRNA nucleotidyltransferase, partial [Dehalococcoidia bacterium]|nr:CCA tRNA nucleotidyltransferase [Dehalococcoidia bacterium]